MISINPELLAQLKVAGAGGTAPLTTSPMAVKAATAAPVAATANPLAVKAATPAPADNPAMTQAIQQSLNNVVGYYQPQTAEEKAYAEELAKYVGGLDAQYGSYGGTRLTGDRLAQLPFGGPQLYKAPTAEQISSYYSKTPEQQTYYSFNLPSNKGNPTGQVNVNYDTPVALYDYRDGKLLYSGTGFEAAEKVAEMARNLSETQGRKAEWGIYTGQPGSTDPSTFKQVAYEKPNQSTLGAVADIALPAALAFLAPYALPATAGTLATAAAVGAGSALGSGISSAAQGRSFGDALKGALISGVTSFGMANIPGLAPKPGGSLFGGGGAGALSSGAVREIGDEIAVTAGKNVAKEAVKAGVSSLGSNAISDLAAKSPMEQGYAPGAVKPTPVLSSSLGGLNAADWLPEVVVSTAKNTVPAAVTGATGALTSAAAANALNNLQQAQTTNEPPAEEPIQRRELTDDEIKVVAKKAVKAGLADSIEVAIQSGVAQALADKLGPDAYADPDKPLTWKDYVKYGVLGVNAVGALAEELGGGGGGTSGGGTGTFVKNPAFSAKLPTPSAGFGGTAGSSFAARPVSTYGGTGQGGGMTMEDWLSYGTRPERSFFSYVPENTATIAPPVTPDTDEDDEGGGRGSGPNDGGPRPRPPRGGRRGRRTRSEEGVEAPRTGRGPKVRKGLIVEKAMGGYAAGGPRRSFAVEGQGTGRSDEIPAVLSDGEYVIDAETVALLGDGSSKAGAKKLDEFRINVRKHKGAKLAKGRFSANAKSPEKYLAGGKA